MLTLNRQSWALIRVFAGSVAIGLVVLLLHSNSGGAAKPVAAGTPARTGASANAGGPNSAVTQLAVAAQPEPAQQTMVPAGAVVVGGKQNAPAAAAAAVTAPATATVPAKVVPHGAGPSAVASVAAYSDGCNHDYGLSGQCIPLVAPGGGPETCASLTVAGYFKQPLVVRVDSLGLMTKRDLVMGETADGKHMTVSGCTD